MMILGIYSTNSQVDFNPSLKDCLIHPDRVPQGKVVTSSGTFNYVGEKLVLQTNLRNFEVITLKTDVPPIGRSVSIAIVCARNNVLEVVKWEDRGDRQFSKYMVSILGLVFTMGVFLLNFRIKSSGIIFK